MHCSRRRRGEEAVGLGGGSRGAFVDGRGDGVDMVVVGVVVDGEVGEELEVGEEVVGERREGVSPFEPLSTVDP